MLRMQIMTRIGAVCLVTIAIWVIIELSVQFGEPSKGRLFGNRRHSCGIGVGASRKPPASLSPSRGLGLRFLGYSSPAAWRRMA